MPGRYRSDTLEQRISIERLEQAVNIFGSFAGMSIMAQALQKALQNKR